MKFALDITRAENFPEWYQAVVAQADLAEASPVRGCMIIKPWGWGVWELVQAALDKRIKETGHENCYFPLFIPLSFIAQEAAHVEGFAKEMAVVTHHRLKAADGKLFVDPESELEEPLVVRPTSETIIGDAFRRWVASYRDLPVLINQWANVVRWEMRTRMFLRTSEFLWQEGHTAHADAEDARAETLKMLEVYRELAEDVLAMPVVVGEKPENERFPGADNTFSIEAMMQDGKALQAGTSHYLGTNFAKAQNIRFQSATGDLEFCHTTSWGVSTRLIGGVIMTHGDDDGLRLPPKIAPKQIVIVPMLREKPEDAEVLAYCEKLKSELDRLTAFSAPVRAHLDKKPARAANKRWDWVRRGAPIILEVGPRDMANDSVTLLRRDRLRDGEKIASTGMTRSALMELAPALLADIQAALFDEAKAKRDANIRTDLATFEAVAAYFGEEAEDGAGAFKGWVRAPWSRPTGAELEQVEQRLKAYKLTLRNAPLGQEPAKGKCVFTGRDAVEDILIARAY
ncbi:proline--tRNA ligase [Methylocystis bryophila]|uniref:Proline--tRNA ligase n=1 Tax=Methylocystis bryophila TaxID=655015 RepID=A0A1W6MR59_9HYPH|nr:proline--tRNA ligase [Methylocystis bryophila]ARN80052.1 proline--tRNA ligase [Methylocystis bryophila]BDV39968.1 proline--tRNA ligase [Methylocystis bryophila]